MKKILLFSLFLILGFGAKAVNSVSWAKQFEDEAKIQALTPEMKHLHVDKFLAMTPKNFKEMTGQKLGIKKTLQLKAAQKFIKHKMKPGAEDIEKGLYIVLAIFNLGWIAMGLMDDWEGKNWWVNLLLSICVIPGIIHAFVKMKDYYS